MHAIFLLLALFAQKPIVEPSGVQNAASLIAQNPPSITPGMLLTLKGQNLAASTGVASSSPWPVSINGTSVTLNGNPASLLFVSPAQINLQVPSALRGAAAASVVVNTTTGTSDPIVVQVAPQSLGIFTQNSTGCGSGAVLNIHADGSADVNTPQNSFDPSRDLGLSLFLTGLGAFADRVDGLPWIYNPADNQSGPGGLVATVGVRAVQTSQGMSVQYAGPAPGAVGLDQVNAIPSRVLSLGEGCDRPLSLVDTKLNTRGSASQFVTVSIHRGGGVCVDPPVTRLGLITWQKNFVSDVGVSSSSDGLNIRFLEGNQLLFPVPGSPPAIGCCTPEVAPSAASCPAVLPLTLGAGTIMVAGITPDPVSLPPEARNVYQTAFPAGTVKGGNYQVNAAGGSIIGPFSAQAAIPPPIAITTGLSPGGALTFPKQITWTGGDDRSTINVIVKVTTPYFSGQFQQFTAASASAGSIDVGNLTFTAIGSPPIRVPNGKVEIIITQTSQPSGPTFTAPGLTLGGRQTWEYVWDFRGLWYSGV